MSIDNFIGLGIETQEFVLVSAEESLEESINIIKDGVAALFSQNGIFELVGNLDVYNGWFRACAQRIMSSDKSFEAKLDDQRLAMGDFYQIILTRLYMRGNRERRDQLPHVDLPVTEEQQFAEAMRVSREDYDDTPKHYGNEQKIAAGVTFLQEILSTMTSESTQKLQDGDLDTLTQFFTLAAGSFVIGEHQKSVLPDFLTTEAKEKLTELRKNTADLKDGQKAALLRNLQNEKLECSEPLKRHLNDIRGAAVVLMRCPILVQECAPRVLNPPQERALPAISSSAGRA